MQRSLPMIIPPQFLCLMDESMTCKEVHRHRPVPPGERIPRSVPVTCQTLGLGGGAARHNWGDHPEYSRHLSVLSPLPLTSVDFATTA